MIQFGNIITTAKNLGACSRLSKGMDAKQLSKLMFTPQGREFCVLNDFPKMDDLRHVTDNVLIANHILVGKHQMEINNPTDIALINSDVRIYVEKPEVLHHIILLEHSCLYLNATNHAVVSLDISKSSYAIVFNDGTSKVFVHGSGKLINKEMKEWIW